MSEVEAALGAAREAARDIESETWVGLLMSLNAYRRLHKAFLRFDAALHAGELLSAPAPPAEPVSKPFEIRMQLLVDLAEALRQRLNRSDLGENDIFLGLSGAGHGYPLAVEMLEAVKILLPPSQGGAPAPIEESGSVLSHGTVAAMGFSKGQEHHRNGNYSTYTMCWLDILPDLRSEDKEDQSVRLYVEKNDGKRFRIGQRIEIRLLPGQGTR